MSEKELLAKLKQPHQQKKAFATLIDLYQERLYWHIRKWVITHENADDVLQNTFVKIYKGLANFNGNSSLLTWMYRIAYNESMTFLKKDKRRKFVSLSHFKDDSICFLTSDSFFDGKEAQLKLQKILFEIPEKQRHIFQMKYYDDLKFVQIAAVLGINQNTIKSQYYAAVTYIKKHIHNISIE